MAEENPAPNAYKPELTKSTLIRPAAFTMKGRVKLGKEKDPKPAPNAYPDAMKADRLRYQTAPIFSTGFKKPTGNKPKPLQAPAPNTYKVNDIKKHPGTFTIKSRVKEVTEKPSAVAPNSFDCTSYLAVGKTGPKQTMHKKFPAPIGKNVNPEPTKYKVVANVLFEASPKFSMRGRIKEIGTKDKQAMPGPAQYAFQPHQKVGTTVQTFGKGKYSKKVHTLME